MLAPILVDQLADQRQIYEAQIASMLAASVTEKSSLAGQERGNQSSNQQ
jgi:hypothetical protein